MDINAFSNGYYLEKMAKKKDKKKDQRLSDAGKELALASESEPWYQNIPWGTIGGLGLAGLGGYGAYKGAYKYLWPALQEKLYGKAEAGTQPTTPTAAPTTAPTAAKVEKAIPPEVQTATPESLAEQEGITELPEEQLAKAQEVAKRYLSPEEEQFVQTPRTKVKYEPYVSPRESAIVKGIAEETSKPKTQYGWLPPRKSEFEGAKERIVKLPGLTEKETADWLAIKQKKITEPTSVPIPTQSVPSKKQLSWYQKLINAIASEGRHPWESWSKPYPEE